MEQLELEGIAEAILRDGGQEQDEAPRLAALVTTHLGRGAVEYSNAMRGDAALVRIRDEWRIYVRRSLPTHRRAFGIAHELAEWWLRVRESYRGEDVEQAANYVAAAILTPRRAVRLARRQLGSNLVRLAEEFGTTETHMALREAEVENMPRVVVSTNFLWVRGPEEWVWPDEATLRRWTRVVAPNVRKTRLTDDPRRTVLDVEQIEDVG